MAEGSGNHKFKSITGMIFCMIISALLWIIIKLTLVYTVTEPFAIRFTDIPADQTIQNDNLSVEATTSSQRAASTVRLRRSKRQQCCSPSTTT